VVPRPLRPAEAVGVALPGESAAGADRHRVAVLDRGPGLGPGADVRDRPDRVEAGDRFQVVGDAAEAVLPAAELVEAGQVVRSVHTAGQDAVLVHEPGGPRADRAVAANPTAADLDPAAAVDHLLRQVAVLVSGAPGDLHADQVLDRRGGAEGDAGPGPALVARRQHVAADLAARLPEEHVVGAVVGGEVRLGPVELGDR
jgi:hypothetical protein